MKAAIPSCDDRPIWDLWLSSTWLASVTVAAPGFTDIDVLPGYGYYSLVSGREP